ncbi:mg595 protein [Tupanvirus deep ocean]|uniref:Mg595 protein n=2 Tax=Tupanvirus TaxID=2094720 RepID=A0AC62A821_9VIRU|nr:mg595 protein [Tupanvirus deep ocean]QKU33808.1 mg595 protein [Tupanvirus deep ocean]
MKIKLLFNIINIDNDLVDPVYIPKTGIIVDKHTGNVIHRFAELEMTNFFYFRVEFSHYEYSSIYLPKTKSYKNKLSKRVYHINLYLQIDAIIRDANITKILYRKLTYYFSIMQIKEIKDKSNYNTDNSFIEKFIEYRNTNFMYLISWYYFRINNHYVFDLKNKKILTPKSITKINFRRKGGIIETNNVEKLINNNFKQNKDTKSLIILPTNMTNLWFNNLKITYDELLCLKKSEAELYKKENINQIIIHECHVQFLVGIKHLIDIIGCNNIWIINSLPLRYYFTIEKTPPKLKINDLATISGLWFNFSSIEKKKYKNEIIKMLLTKFNQYYTVVKYNNDDVANIKTIKLEMTDFEKYIYNVFNKYYENWKNKLTNDPKNTYSVATIEKSKKVESKIYNAVITLITAVLDDHCIPNFYEKSIRSILIKTNNIKNKFDHLINIYYEVNKVSDYVITENDVINFDHILNDLKDKKTKAETRIYNYKRYLEGNVYKIIDDKCCPICYSTEQLIKTKLICGHSLCLECTLSTLGTSSKCPICNEYINIHKIAIIKNTIDKYHSNIVSYFKTLNKNSIILTDLHATLNLLINPEYNTHIIDINKSNVVSKIKKIQKIDTIIIFSTPSIIMSKKTFKEFEQVLNFFNLFNNKPKIIKIEIII